MPVQVVALNGGSGAGKTGIARCRPAILPQPWISNRAAGMAASQAETVHQGVVYDIEIDTSHAESLDCARVIAARVV